jgi:hypothetical protein
MKPNTSLTTKESGFNPYRKYTFTYILLHFLNNIIYIIILFFVILYVILQYQPKPVSNDYIKQITMRYIKLIYKNPPKKRKMDGKKELTNRFSVTSSNLRENSKGTEKRGLIGTELLFIGPAGTSMDSLISLLSSLHSPGMDSPDLDAVLSKVRTFRLRGDKMNPALESTPLPEYRLKLEKTYSPEIDTTRIENDIFHVQAPRNSIEVEQILKENERMIRYCFRKHRYEMSHTYTISVEFEIDFRGYVIPASVKIINTNIQNPELIRCIRRTISRWRNFGAVEFTQGTYKVRQKWIF